MQIVLYEGTTDAMREVETGKLDATLADLPAVVFYRDRFKGLVADRPAGRQGYYVIFVRRGDMPCAMRSNAALDKLLADGRLEHLYETIRHLERRAGRACLVRRQRPTAAGHSGHGSAWLGRHSQPRAAAGRSRRHDDPAGLRRHAAGDALGAGRGRGPDVRPAPLRWLLVGYVEVLRGTPLMLQLYRDFLPAAGDRRCRFPAFWAAVAGLAINYSAYEAEIYRAGLQAVPRGQMEAALALGMSPRRWPCGESSFRRPCGS